MVKSLIVATCATALLLGTTGAAQAGTSSAEVRWFSNGSVVAGAWSTLTTTGSGATATLHTTGLEAGDQVTVLWVVFNAPENCSHGEGPYRCGPGDLPPFGGDGSAEPSLLVAGSRMVDATGSLNIGARLRIDDTTNAVFGPGLTDPTGADIHLLIQDGGTNVQFSVHEQ